MPEVDGKDGRCNDPAGQKAQFTRQKKEENDRDIKQQEENIDNLLQPGSMRRAIDPEGDLSVEKELDEEKKD